MASSDDQQKAIDALADVFLYAPVGLALEVQKALPGLIEAGKAKLDAPLGAAKVVGKLAVDQHRHQLAEKLRNAAEPYFGSPPSQQSPGSTHVTSDPGPPDVPTETTLVTHVPTVAGDAAPNSIDASTLAIEGYENLSATQINEHLEGLSNEALDAIHEYETANRRRLSILARIDQLRTEQ